jgi:transcriptional regulator with XRE-family HTH domain
MGNHVLAAAKKEAMRLHVGPRIAARRNLVGDLKQEALAHACGVTQITVSRWERGITVPHHADQLRLAEALSVTRTELFREVIAVDEQAAR